MEHLKAGNILVVNDLPDQLELLDFELSKVGFNCLTAGDGAAAFDLAHYYHPDLIISDVSMPIMDGLELCRRIRTDAELFATPILLLSAIYRHTESVVKGIEVGADDYLGMPYDPLLLVVKATRLIERKRLEDEIYHAKQFLSKLLDNVPSSIYVEDREGKLSLANKGWEKVTRLNRDRSMGRRSVELFPGHLGIQAERTRKEVIKTGKPLLVEEEMEISGQNFYFQTVKFPLFNRAGEVESVGGIAIDITEQKRAEVALRTSENRLRQQNEALLKIAKHSYVTDRELLPTIREVMEIAAHTLEVARVSVWLYDTERLKIQCLDLYDRNAGYHSGGYELVRQHYPAYFRALEVEPTIAARDARTDERTKEFTDDYLIPYGITSMLDAPLRVGGQVVGVVCHEHIGPARQWMMDEQNFAGSMSDVISLLMEADQRRRAEAELQRSKLQVNNILESISEAFYTMNFDGQFTYLNAEAERLLGYPRETLIGRRVVDAFPEVRGTTFDREIRRVTREQIAVEFVEFYPPPLNVWFEVHAYPSAEGVSIYFRDVTRQKLMDDTLRDKEEQLRQAQKMEAVGRLAGGVAHDFNNLLTVISGYTDLSLRQLRDDEPLHKNLTEVKKAAHRAAGMTRQLLTFSRKQMLQPRILNLSAAVADMTEMLQRLIGEDIDLQTEFAPAGVHIQADPGQLEQVVMNLAVNSRDAMSDGGRLTVSTRESELTEAAHPPAIEPGRYAVLEISDTGTGMDGETLEHIFEPFFTTKEIGKGTGLGLSTVYGIVQQSGGSMTVESQIGQGTTFRIYFPKIDEPVVRLPVNHVGGELRQGGETILLVEDDDMVRHVALTTLQLSGYKVLTATQGSEAINLAEQFQGHIDLIVTDVVMPNMNGRALVERLRQVRPDLKVLYMSGYTNDTIGIHGILEESTNFIDKPFTPRSLSQKVREVLDSGLR